MNKRNLVLDILILAAFLLAMVPNLTGEGIHEWMSLGLLLAVVIHLLFHWDWIVEVGARFFKKLWHISRLKFFVDIFVFLSFITVSLSGIMISKTVLPTLGLNSGQTSMIWKQLHSLSADASILLIGLHFALNWGWVVSSFKKYVIAPAARLFRSRKAEKPSMQETTLSNN